MNRGQTGRVHCEKLWSRWRDRNRAVRISATARGCQRYIASDIDGEHLSRLETRLGHHPYVETRACDLSNSVDFELFADAVDTVICLNVLEHIEDDRAGLCNIYSALSPGGRAIVLVPCGQEIYGQLDIILGHRRRYSASQLRDLFEQVGFEIERIVEFNRISRPGWYITGKLLRRSRISRFQLQMFDRLVWLWRRIDRFLPWKPTSLIVIAAKPQVQVPVAASSPLTHRQSIESTQCINSGRRCAVK
jgi:SAM-dependent methyltransferase